MFKGWFCIIRKPIRHLYFHSCMVPLYQLTNALTNSHYFHQATATVINLGRLLSMPHWNSPSKALMWYHHSQSKKNKKIIHAKKYLLTLKRQVVYIYDTPIPGLERWVSYIYSYQFFKYVHPYDITVRVGLGIGYPYPYFLSISVGWC